MHNKFYIVFEFKFLNKFTLILIGYINSFEAVGEILYRFVRMYKFLLGLLLGREFLVCDSKFIENFLSSVLIKIKKKFSLKNIS